MTGEATPAAWAGATITIVADDLTGAADCGLQAARRGLPTVVALAPPGPAADRAAAAVAWDVDARAASPELARNRTRAAAGAAAPGDVLYVKVDSSLRGHVGAAVDAALEAAGAKLAVIAPAFPSMGRTTLRGSHRIASSGSDAHGMTVDLPALLRTQSAHPVHHLALDAVRSGGVRKALDGFAGSGPWLLSADCVQDDDLELLVSGVRDDGRPLVWVGSAGLASALMDVLLGRPSPPGPFPRASGPLLTVSGSLAPEALAQVEVLGSAGGITRVSVDPEALDDDGEPRASAVRDAAARLAEALAGGGDALLCVTRQRDDPAGAGAGPAPTARIADRLGEIVAAALAGTSIGGLLMTGGATARSVCAALGIEAIELLGEVAPGVPVGRATGRELLVVTKAGAFGPPDALASARQILQRSPS